MGYKVRTLGWELGHTGREALQDLGSGFYVLVVTELSGKSSLALIIVRSSF